jgi:1-acyl-sn-glycerol-3-phosphate acyltransferase
MSPVTPKPQIWLLEEATPEVAQLMFQLERSLGPAGQVQRVTYTDALRQLPKVVGELTAIVVFSVTALTNLAKLLKGYAGPRPRLCFHPTTYEAVSKLRSGMRWPVPVSAVARHAGEAWQYELAGIKPEHVVRPNADVDGGHLPEGDRPSGRPMRIGFAWPNLSATQRELLGTEIARWNQASPDRFEWLVAHLPGAAPPEDALPGVVRVELGPETLDLPPLDVLLADPWWPDVLPRPWRAPVQVHLAPGGQVANGWEERLQGLIDLGDQAGWEDDTLWTYAMAPLWRHLIKGEERALAPMVVPDLSELVAERMRWQVWLDAARSGDPHPSFYFRVYDFRVQVSWCLDFWTGLQTAKNGERFALVSAMNSLRLHHTNSAWLMKRLVARTARGRADAPARHFGRRFWLRFGAKHPKLLARWGSTLWRCGRDEAADPLGASREVAAAVLSYAGIQVVRRNEPEPEAGVPTLYLLSHRHGDLDPFLLLHVLPEHLSVVVGPRAQRWPLMERLGYSSAFVLTGRERGVVIADAIAAMRARRALALYPEVAEPTYLGEGAPLRAGLQWIVQALERSQVIPVVLDDAFTLGPAGGTVDVWFGKPIPVTPGTSDGLLEQVRMFYHAHVRRMNALDMRGTGELRAVVPAVPVEEKV